MIGNRGASGQWFMMRRAMRDMSRIGTEAIIVAAEEIIPYIKKNNCDNRISCVKWS